jgi:hypothetical protein
MEAKREAPGTAAAHGRNAKPDARPMRFALGAGGIAALSAIATAIVLPPRPAPPVELRQATSPLPQAGTTAVPATTIQVERPIRYVQLSPGQTAPPGATVIPATAPTPITVVVTVDAPAAQQPATGQQPAPVQAPVIIKTTQSGKVVP